MRSIAGSSIQNNTQNAMVHDSFSQGNNQVQNYPDSLALQCNSSQISNKSCYPSATGVVRDLNNSSLAGSREAHSKSGGMFQNLLGGRDGLFEMPPMYVQKQQHHSLENPRANIEQRIQLRFRLPKETQMITMHGETVDLSSFENKVHIPNTKCFSQVKFTNPLTGRLASVFTCDHRLCGKFFRKWHNLFDHLRVHTSEKPFPCPVYGCPK